MDEEQARPEDEIYLDVEPIETVEIVEDEFAGEHSTKHRYDDLNLAYLATGFAQGELDDEEMGELYRMLCLPDGVGEEVAQKVWRHLGIAMDLRCSLSTRFQDTLRHFIKTESEYGALGRDRFVVETMRQLGLERPRLSYVPVPASDGDRGVPLGPVLLAIAALLLLVATSILVFMPQTEDVVVRVADVNGIVKSEGVPLTKGMELERRTILVAEGSRLNLEWPLGARVIVRGPASLVPQGEGMSLVRGRAWVDSTKSFVLGLPDQRVEVAAAMVAVESRGHQSVLAVERGQARLLREPHTTPQQLDAGMVRIGERIFAWETEPTFKQEALFEREQLALSLTAGEKATVWHLRADVAIERNHDSLSLVWKNGETMDRRRLMIRQKQIILYDKNDKELRSWVIPGAPRLSRKLRLDCWAGVTAVDFDGLDEPIVLNSFSRLERLLLAGNASVDNIHFHTGPAPDPASDQ